MIFILDVYKDIKSTIDFIQSIYSNITNEWLKTECSKVNLKKKCVSDIDLSEDIYFSINEYTKFLNGKCPFVADELNKLMIESYISSRVKSQNSIEAKIQGYRSAREHEFGKVPIIKCLNDLLGIRIILKTPLTFDEIYDFIRITYDDKYKCIDSSKLEYKATHLYFKDSNKTFPWELQIWNENNRESNFISHKKHKQAYTLWEKENKKGGIISD